MKTRNKAFICFLRLRGVVISFRQALWFKISNKPKLIVDKTLKI